MSESDEKDAAKVLKLIANSGLSLLDLLQSEHPEQSLKARCPPQESDLSTDEVAAGSDFGPTPKAVLEDAPTAQNRNSLPAPHSIKPLLDEVNGKPDRHQLAYARRYACLLVVFLRQQKKVSQTTIGKLLDLLGIGMKRSTLTASLNKMKSPDNAEVPKTLDWEWNNNIAHTSETQKALVKLQVDLPLEVTAVIDSMVTKLLTTLS